MVLQTALPPRAAAPAFGCSKPANPPQPAAGQFAYNTVTHDELLGSMPDVVVRRGAPVTQAAVPKARVLHVNRAAQRFAAPIAKTSQCYLKHEAQRIADLQLPNLAAEVVDPTMLESKTITGRQRYARARKALGAFGLTPSPMQKLFFNNMFGAAAKLIFRDDFDIERDDFMLDLGLTRMQPQFMAITPRRFGKTYSVAMFVVAMAFAVEGIEQAIFSTGRRASSKLLDLIYSFMCHIPGMKESIQRHNVETIWIDGPHGPKDVRKISSYPSKVKVSGESFSYTASPAAPVSNEVRHRSTR